MPSGARRNAPAICRALEGLDDPAALCLKAELEAGKPASISVNDTSFPLSLDMVKIAQQQKKVSSRCDSWCFLPGRISANTLNLSFERAGLHASMTACRL